MSLDELLPSWHFRELHRRATTAKTEALLAAAEQVTWAEVPVMRLLMGVRSGGRLPLPTHRPILEDMAGLGFVVLERAEAELVVGSIGRPWTASGGSAPQLVDVSDPAGTFAGFAEPSWVKIIFNFRVGAGALSTETRVLATDARARHAFGRYWLVIRPFSGVIRRRWLAAIARRARQP